MICAVYYGVFITSALEVQRRSLEQLAKDKVEHVLKESEAKYQSELVKEVSNNSSTQHVVLSLQDMLCARRRSTKSLTTTTAC